MTRIGLVIFGTVITGLMLNISLFSSFYGISGCTLFTIALLIYNFIVLGYIVAFMIHKKQKNSYILFTILVYSFITLKLISGYEFSEYTKEQEVINGNFLVKNIESDEENGRYTYYLKIDDLDEKKIIFNKKILITSYYDLDLDIGDKIQSTIKINVEDNSYAFSRGSETSGYILNYEKVGSRFVFKKFANDCQSKLENNIDTLFGDDYGDIVSTFLIGTDFENDNNKNALIVTGIYHIMAISGMHIGILSTIVLAILNYLFFRKTALRLGIGVIIFYGFITGLSFSTTRAILMIIIALVAKILSIKADRLNTVGVAGVIILMINPFALYNMGFIYSFSIVFGLILTVPTVKYIIKTCFRLNYNKEYRLVDYFSTIIVAQLYFIPISLWYYGNLYIYSFIVNALVIFIVPILFSFSLLTVVLSFTFFSNIFIINIFVLVVKFLINYILLTANYFERLPYAEIYVGNPSIVVVFMVYVVLFCISYFGTKRIYEVNNGYFRRTKKFGRFQK